MPAARRPTYAPALLVTNSSDQGLLTACCTSVLFLNQPHPMQCDFPSCLSGPLSCFLQPFVSCHPVPPPCVHPVLPLKLYQLVFNPTCFAYFQGNNQPQCFLIRPRARRPDASETRASMALARFCLPAAPSRLCSPLRSLPFKSTVMFTMLKDTDNPAAPAARRRSGDIESHQPTCSQLHCRHPRCA